MFPSATWEERVVVSKRQSLRRGMTTASACHAVWPPRRLGLCQAVMVPPGHTSSRVKSPGSGEDDGKAMVEGSG